MGWTYPYNMESRRELIADRIREQRGTRHGVPAIWRTVKHCYRGGRYRGVLWKVVQIVNAETTEVLDSFIGCDLLQYTPSKEYGSGWGYKDMCESVGPMYYTCPVSYLDMVPMPTDSSYAAEWRVKVRAYYTKRYKKLEVGETYEAAPGIKIGSRRILRIKVTSLKPLRGDAYLEAGGEYPERVKFSKKHVLSQEEAAERDAKVEADRKKAGVSD